MCRRIYCNSNELSSTWLQAGHRSRRSPSKHSQQRRAAVKRACSLRLKTLRRQGRSQTWPLLASLGQVKPQLPRKELEPQAKLLLHMLSLQPLDSKQSPWMQWGRDLKHLPRMVLLSTVIASLHWGSQQCQHPLNLRSHSRLSRQAADQQEQTVRGRLQMRSLPAHRLREVRVPWMHRQWAE